MTEYEVDLKTLEDMCSELSESCVLLNKELKIIWYNDVFKKNFKNSEFLELLSMFDISKEVLKVFETGKLKKLNSGNILEITIIPVRYYEKVGYVLCIIENYDKNSKALNYNIQFSGINLIKYFLEDIKTPSILYDTNFNYIGHNSMLLKEFYKAKKLLDLLLALAREKKNAKEILSDINGLVALTHKADIKPLFFGKQKAGYLMVFQKNKR